MSKDRERETGPEADVNVRLSLPGTGYYSYSPNNNQYRKQGTIDFIVTIKIFLF
jgi:hypothetical protein